MTPDPDTTPDRHQQPASLRDALLAFMIAEFRSPTERTRMVATLQRLSLPESVLTDPNVPDDVLWQLFMSFRGGESLFDTLDLRRLHWIRTSLSLDDLLERTFSCRHGYQSAYGTRAIGDLIGRVDHAERSKQILQRAQITLPPPALLVAQPAMTRFVILEGHNRLLAYAAQTTPVVEFPLPVLVGTAEEVSEWHQW